MITLDELNHYIDLNILNSKLFDGLDDKTKEKAMNQSLTTLIRFLPQIYKNKESISVEIVAEQVLWILRIDDTIQRSEMGVTSISIDGISMSVNEKERTIAPSILFENGIESIKKRVIGSYSVEVGDLNKFNTDYSRQYWRYSR